jgi:hypothetical protein
MQVDERERWKKNVAKQQSDVGREVKMAIIEIMELNEN